MPWFPGARKRPVAGHTDGPMSKHLGVVLHVNASNGNLHNWVAGDHDMSCHFEVYKNGSAEQYLDTDVSSWAQMDGNGTYVSIETEGYPKEPLTPAQLEKVAQIVAWLHLVHGIPLQLAEHPGERGLGWHGMGGAKWGGHTGCPGDKRKAQRGAILARARALTGAHPHPHPAAPAHGPKLPKWPFVSPLDYLGLLSGPLRSHGGIDDRERRYVAILQDALHYVTGQPIHDPRGRFGGSTREVLMVWQKREKRRVTGKLYRPGWGALRKAVERKAAHR